MRWVRIGMVAITQASVSRKCCAATAGGRRELPAEELEGKRGGGYAHRLGAYS